MENSTENGIPNVDANPPDERTDDMIRKSVLNFQKEERRSRRQSRNKQVTPVPNYDSDSSIEIVDVDEPDEDISAEASRKRRLKDIHKKTARKGGSKRSRKSSDSDWR